MARTKSKKEMQNNVEACSKLKPKPKPKPNNDAQGKNGSALGKRRFRDTQSDDDKKMPTLTLKGKQKRARLLEKKRPPAAIVVSAPELQTRVAFTFAELCAAAADDTPDAADHAQFDRFLAKVHETVEGFTEEDYCIYWEYGDGDARAKYKVTNPSSWRAAMLEMRDGGCFTIELKLKQEAEGAPFLAHRQAKMEDDSIIHRLMIRNDEQPPLRTFQCGDIGAALLPFAKRDRVAASVPDWYGSDRSIGSCSPVQGTSNDGQMINPDRTAALANREV
ncbi:hypothetical protein BO99DRAFT_444823 [Aspergillus violaceofuscus CBS 115571]|uniref:Uncharacterized protein n=1 Tax=Aspergillus violaceofuscus (strain CBS 115571) TaxID=1450538 RepID=A0A2V5H0F1_ASPV1|nr:hypothetical protein BO99DRAFT_444823 [Aspergillus violaceofuscus CBS 115571]